MFQEGKTYRAICKATGASETYAKQIIFRARKKGLLPPTDHFLTEEEKEERGTDHRLVNVGQTPEERAKDALANWEKSPLSAAMKESKSDLNRMAGAFVLECIKMGQMVDRSDPKSLYDGLINYASLCTQAGMPMLVKTACLALGINKQDIYNWKDGRQKASDPRYKQFAEMFQSVIGAGLEASAAAGSVDRVLTIWWEKAHFNMTEGTGVEPEQEQPLGERVSSEDIIKKYGGLPD